LVVSVLLFQVMDLCNGTFIFVFFSLFFGSVYLLCH
jgi:hypothetical protein